MVDDKEIDDGMSKIERIIRESNNRESNTTIESRLVKRRKDFKDIEIESQVSELVNKFEKGMNFKSFSL